MFHGVAMTGGAITTINPTYTEHEVHHQLVDSGATILVTIPMFLEIGDGGREGHRRPGDLRARRGGGRHPGDRAVRRAARRAGAGRSRRPRRAAVLVGHDRADQGRDAHATATSWPTSRRCSPAPTSSEDETFIAVLPFFHIYGMQVLMNTGLRAGATIVTMPRFDLEQFLSLHQEHGITRSFVAPPIVVALAKHPMVDNYDLSALRAGLLRRGAAVGRARDRVRRAARLRGRAGLRHDRAVAGLAPHPAGQVQARLGRRHRAEHRDRGSSTR